MAVLKADPEYRRNIFFLYAAALVLGYALIKWGLPEFDAFLKQKKSGEAFNILLFDLRVLFLSLLPWALYLFNYGLRILRTGQYPPTGAKVIHDTEIIEGMPARRKAQIIILVSLLITVLALLGALYFPYKLVKAFNVKNVNQKTSDTLKSDTVANRRVL